MPINYKRYPPNWKEIRQRILLRANNKCEQCQAPNYSHAVTVGTSRTYSIKPSSNSVRIILTVAHLDHDPENWSVTDDRLQALCQRCHLNYDRVHNQNKRKPGKEFKAPEASI